MAANDALVKAKKKKALARIEAGDFEGAKQIYADLCRSRKRDAELWYLRGAVEGRLGDPAGAADCSRQALAIAPRHTGALYNLAIALRDLGQDDEAIDALERTLALAPDHVGAPGALAHLLMAQGRLDRAAEVLRSALRRAPANADWQANLGAILQLLGEHEEAADCLRRSLALKPRAATHDNLGVVLCSQGRCQEALECHQAAIAREPSHYRAHSNLLLTMQYLEDVTAQSLLSAHRGWSAVHEGGSPQKKDFPNAGDGQRRLRVGYVSPDMRIHSVAYFLEPLLANHDPTQVEVCCYSDVARPDDTTRRLKAQAGIWRDTAVMTDEQLAAQVRQDGVDILVDLAGHTSGNRLKVFAARPAPLQITYLGYPGTTGLNAIDYRITDGVADPPGAEAFHTEVLLRLDGCFLCYRAPLDAPSVAPSPAAEAGCVTFGSFNNLAKMNAAVVALWAGVLEAVPGARLLLKNPSLSDGASRQRYLRMFEDHGVAPERVELLGRTPTPVEHLALYGRVDIALDTFPYAGTTTTCEALWMGVPVISLAGERHAGRVGASLLAVVGHPEWVASSPEDYIAIAGRMARDPEQLQRTRALLREKMARSALCDEAAFVRRLEAAYRQAWRDWCQG